jgi:hypothetical protein
MQEKIIKQNLNKIFSNWVSSIKDKDLQSLVREKSIITGGCITSMILNEEVNDYDIYFQDKGTVKAVCDYYVNIFNKKNNGKIARVIVDKNDRISISLLDINNEKKNNKVKKNSGKYNVLFLTENAITLSDNIQLIIRFYGPPEEIHKNYDFVHCTAYWNSKTNCLNISKEVYECTINKVLRYQGSKYPIASIFRIKKFLKRGWNINAGQMLKIALQINELDLHDFNIFKDQLVGVDILYFIEMLNLLKSNEGIIPDFTQIERAIDKVFEHNEEEID